MRGLWEAHYRLSKVLLPWLAAHTDFVVNTVQGASDRGEGRFAVTIKEGSGPPVGNFVLTEILSKVHQRYDGVTEWTAYRGVELARIFRSTNSEVWKAVNQGDNNQHEERRPGEEAEASCNYCGGALDDSAGRSRDNVQGYQSRPPTGGWCTSAPCWSERTSSREGMQIRVPASRATPSGRETDNAPNRWSLVEVCQ